MKWCEKHMGAYEDQCPYCEPEPAEWVKCRAVAEARWRCNHKGALFRRHLESAKLKRTAYCGCGQEYTWYGGKHEGLPKWVQDSVEARWRTWGPYREAVYFGVQALQTATRKK